MSYRSHVARHALRTTRDRHGRHERTSRAGRVAHVSVWGIPLVRVGGRIVLWPLIAAFLVGLLDVRPALVSFAQVRLSLVLWIVGRRGLEVGDEYSLILNNEKKNVTGPEGVNSAAATLSLNFALDVAVVAVVQTESASETLSGKFSDCLAGDDDLEPTAEEAILEAAEVGARGGVAGTEGWPRGGVALGSGITGTLVPPGTMGLGGEAG